MYGKAVIAALGVTGGVALCAAPALARAATTTLRCGDTVTSSVTLSSDLRDCPGDGLVIGADGITVDLGGHTIDGVTSAADACTEPPGDDDGIDNRAGHDRVTVRNGTVREFTFGVTGGGEQDGMTGGVIRDLELVDDAFNGISLTGDGTRDVVVTGNHATGEGCGGAIFLVGVSGTRVVANRVDSKTDGIDVFGGAGNQVARNSLSAIRNDAIVVGGSPETVVEGNTLSDLDESAIVVIDDTTGNVVARNRVEGTRNAGIRAEPPCCDSPGPAPSGVQIVGNTLVATNDGIVLAATRGATVRGNSITGATCGDAARCGLGILAFDGASGTLITSNRIEGKEAEGIAVGVPPSLGDEPARAVADTTVEGNTVTGQGLDGIFAGSASTTLRRNRANRNGRLGIHAVAGAIDGGGNRARDNGDPRECVGVVCR